MVSNSSHHLGSPSLWCLKKLNWSGPPLRILDAVFLELCLSLSVSRHVGALPPRATGHLSTFPHKVRDTSTPTSHLLWNCKEAWRVASSDGNLCCLHKFVAVHNLAWNVCQTCCTISLICRMLPHGHRWHAAHALIEHLRISLSK